MVKNERKPVKEPKSELLTIHIKDTTTNEIICSFPPTRSGENRANRYKGLANIQIIKIYSKGGNQYESN